MDLITAINTVLWVGGNIILFIDFVFAAIFVVCYFLFWDIRTTTGGEHVWTAFLSLVGLGFLNFLGLFIDGRVEWWMFPPEVAVWRPIVRLIIYAFVGVAFARLVVFLFRRKFWPATVTRAPDEFTAPRPHNISRRKK